MKVKIRSRLLRREILEEVGIDITSAKVGLVDNKGKGETEKILKGTGETVLCKMKFNVYRVDVEKDSSDIRTSLDDDLVEIAWVDPKKLGNYKLTPPSVTLFARLGYL
jgi:8-oxo-dGTP pyrophosphatase MutT (NUDIX family)